MGILNIILFDDDDLTKAMVDKYLKDADFPFQLFKYDEFNENCIPCDNNKNIIFININNSNNILFNKVEQLCANKKNIFVIISSDNSTDLHVRALRSGAKDFLIKPLVKSDFINLIINVYKNEIVNKVGDIMSNIYTVVSSESGMGKTFFLVNLAKEVADLSKEKVLVVDFNNNVNDISIMLDINSKYNTSFILHSIDENNAQSLLANIQKYKDSSMYILANGLYTNSLSVSIDKLKIFLQEAQKVYKYIFFDIDSQFEGLNNLILSSSKAIYCLVDMKVNSAEKIKNYLITNNLYSKVRFIVNKYRERDRERVQDVETAIEKQVFCKIPQAAMSASMSMQNGKTLKELNPNMDIVKVYTQLASNIVSKD